MTWIEGCVYIAVNVAVPLLGLTSMYIALRTLLAVFRAIGGARHR